MTTTHPSRIVRFLGVLTVLVTLLTDTVRAEDLIYPGEELTYSVSYLGITLGTIRSVSEGWTTIDGRKVAKVKVYIDSHPNIPFVSLHSIYESFMDPSVTYSHRFQANTRKDDNTWEYDQYLFNYDEKKLVMEKYTGKQKVKSTIFETSKRFNDGSSLLFAARRLVYAKKSYRLPTALMEDTVSTIINFQGKIEPQEIDAVNYPIRTVYFNGDANWTGIYGLSGRFEGWFSDDDARVPIVAKMKVYVGNVRIELVKWKRGTWQPPKAG
jgi:hypothetical protein